MASNLKVVPWRQPEEVDEPEFGDGDGGGEDFSFDECEYCGGKHLRAVVQEDMKIILCADCTEHYGTIYCGGEDGE